jgi:hypothetical protein
MVVLRGWVFLMSEVPLYLPSVVTFVTPKVQSDSEVILHCYKHWGTDATVARLRGMFAFVIVPPPFPPSKVD